MQMSEHLNHYDFQVIIESREVEKAMATLYSWHFSFHLKYLALQYSCLENPMDGGAW